MHHFHIIKERRIISILYFMMALPYTNVNVSNYLSIVIDNNYGASQQHTLPSQLHE